MFIDSISVEDDPNKSILVFAITFATEFAARAIMLYKEPVTTSLVLVEYQLRHLEITGYCLLTLTAFVTINSESHQ